MTKTAAITAQLERLVGNLDPADVPLSWTPRLYRDFDRIERLAAAAKTLLADRVAESEVWRREGHRHPADYLAAVSGSSLTHARTQLATSKKLSDLPATAKALREGELSSSQAEHIADAANVNPDAERRLLATAAAGASLGELRDACGRAKAAGDADPDETFRRLRRERRLRQHRDTDGAWRFNGKGTVDDQAVFNAALNPIIDELFATADQATSRDQLTYDAIIELARRSTGRSGTAEPTRRSKGQARANHYLGLIRVDHAALVRGHPEGDEVCEIAGLGPIPVTRARELLGDAQLKLILTKGVEVVNVTHLGRAPTAAQKAALAWLMPQCAVLGCNHSWVEHDHRIPWAKVHETRLDNLDCLCPFHHWLKTRFRWALVEGEGKRSMVSPDDPRHPEHAKPPTERPDQSTGPDTGRPPANLHNAVATTLLENRIQRPPDAA